MFLNFGIKNTELLFIVIIVEDLWGVLKCDESLLAVGMVEGSLQLVDRAVYGTLLAERNAGDVAPLLEGAVVSAQNLFTELPPPFHENFEVLGSERV